MSNNTNGTLLEFETSAFTTISEIFTIATATIAILLNSLLIVCVWKVTTFSSGLRIFFINFGVSACVCAFGSLNGQISNVGIRILCIESVALIFCNSIRNVFSVPKQVVTYQLAAIGAERLIGLFHLKRKKKVETSGWFYCRKS